MGTHSFHRWSNFETMTMEDNWDAFSTFPRQLDLSSQNPGYSAFGSQSEFPIQEAAFPIQKAAFDGLPPTEINPIHPFSSWQYFGAMEFPFQDFVAGDVWNEVNVTPQEVNAEEKKMKRGREEKGSSCKSLLSKSAISKYFYLPITQAAKELNIGVTLLKKRCREVGIRRWPHRKLMSLQTLIKNVQEMEKEGQGINEQKLREAIKILEHEKKLMEEVPDMQLEDKTKRLRQACFKANYKKRKLMGMNVMQSPCFSHGNIHASIDAADAMASGSRVLLHHDDDDDDDDEVIKSLFADCFSSSITNFYS